VEKRDDGRGAHVRLSQESAEQVKKAETDVRPTKLDAYPARRIQRSSKRSLHRRPMSSRWLLHVTDWTIHPDGALPTSWYGFFYSPHFFSLIDFPLYSVDVSSGARNGACIGGRRLSTVALRQESDNPFRRRPPLLPGTASSSLPIDSPLYSVARVDINF
jgi:hypothetical protein